jgi:hypothetical protein
MRPLLYCPAPTVSTICTTCTCYTISITTGSSPTSLIYSSSSSLPSACKMYARSLSLITNGSLVCSIIPALLSIALVWRSIIILLY